MRADQVSESEKLFSLDQPSLRGLSYVLRHKELWPKGFEWGYEDCLTCAMGMASRMWSDIGFPASSAMTRVFGMPLDVAKRIFGGGDVEQTYGTRIYSYVTPEMVADKIDEYLAW